MLKQEEAPSECEACSNTKDRIILGARYGEREIKLLNNMWLCEPCIIAEKRVDKKVTFTSTNNPNLKLCQSCIERGFNPPNPATREWQKDVYYCEDCFSAIINNLTNIAPAAVQQNIKLAQSGPILDKLYELLNIPKELQFDSTETVCRNHEKFFNFGAPAIVNRSLEDLATEVEQMSMAMFIIKYVAIEPKQLQINKLKEERRREKQLTGLEDSRETYAKAPRGTRVKQTEIEKMAKTLGMTVEQYQEFVKSTREKEFNKLVGNCPECGNAPHNGQPCPPKSNGASSMPLETPKPVELTEEEKLNRLNTRLSEIKSQGTTALHRSMMAKAYVDIYKMSLTDAKAKVDEYLSA